MEVEGDKVILTFENADGLNTRDGKMPDNFKLKNTKNRYNTAKAQIVDNKVVLSSKTDMARPVTVRYCWSDSSQPNLCNGAGLPAAPFRANGKNKVTLMLIRRHAGSKQRIHLNFTQRVD